MKVMRHGEKKNQGILFHEHDTCVPSYCKQPSKQASDWHLCSIQL